MATWGPALNDMDAWGPFNQRMAWNRPAFNPGGFQWGLPPQLPGQTAAPAAPTWGGFTGGIQQQYPSWQPPAMSPESQANTMRTRAMTQAAPGPAPAGMWGGSQVVPAPGMPSAYPAGPSPAPMSPPQPVAAQPTPGQWAAPSPAIYNWQQMPDVFSHVQRPGDRTSQVLARQQGGNRPAGAAVSPEVSTFGLDPHPWQPTLNRLPAAPDATAAMDWKRSQDRQVMAEGLGQSMPLNSATQSGRGEWESWKAGAIAHNQNPTEARWRGGWQGGADRNRPASATSPEDLAKRKAVSDRRAGEQATRQARVMDWRSGVSPVQREQATWQQQQVESNREAQQNMADANAIASAVAVMKDPTPAQVTAVIQAVRSARAAPGGMSWQAPKDPNRFSVAMEVAAKARAAGQPLANVRQAMIDAGLSDAEADTAIMTFNPGKGWMSSVGRGVKYGLGFGESETYTPDTSKFRARFDDLKRRQAAAKTSDEKARIQQEIRTLQADMRAAGV